MKHAEFKTAEGILRMEKHKDYYSFGKTQKELKNYKIDKKLINIQKAVNNSYFVQGKQPLLVVGTNTFISQKLPSLINKEFDLFLFFYPNNYSAWVFSCLALSRNNKAMPPIWVANSDLNVLYGIKKTIWELIPKVYEEPNDSGLNANEEPFITQKKNEWINKWIYTCPKISLKDVLHLQNYTEKQKDKDIIKEISNENNNVVNIFGSYK